MERQFFALGWNLEVGNSVWESNAARMVGKNRDNQVYWNLGMENREKRFQIQKGKSYLGCGLESISEN